MTPASELATLNKPTALFGALLLVGPATTLAQGTGPNGAIARCGDGGFVYVDSGLLTCSGHNGVKEWFRPVGRSTPSTAPNEATSQPTASDSAPTPTAPKSN